MSVCANALDHSHPAGTGLQIQFRFSGNHTGDERNVSGHFQLQAGTLASAKAALGEKKSSPRREKKPHWQGHVCPSSSSLERCLTRRRTTRTHHPTPSWLCRPPRSGLSRQEPHPAALAPRPTGAQTPTHMRRCRRCLRDRSTPKQNSLRPPAFTHLAGGSSTPREGLGEGWG